LDQWKNVLFLKVIKPHFFYSNLLKLKPNQMSLKRKQGIDQDLKLQKIKKKIKKKQLDK